MVCRSLAADIIIFNENKVLLVKRGHEPFKDLWALPGGRLEANETIEQCAIREAKEEIGVDIKIKKLVGVFSNPNRDPRGIVGVAFLCEFNGNVKSGSDAKEVKWFPIKEALDMPLAFDHNLIIKKALEIKD